MKYLNEAQFIAQCEDPREYDKKRIESDKLTVKEIQKFFPCELLYNVSVQENKMYFEGTQIFLTVDNDLKIRIHKDSKGKFNIYCRSLQELKNINHYTIEKAQKLFEAPKKIGVLTTKKVIDWVNYWQSVYNEVSKEENENSNEKNAFLKSIEGMKVQWFNNGKSGEIIKNGIKFIFKIEDTFVSQRIEIYYDVPNSVESFLKLANNTYTSKK